LLAGVLLVLGWTGEGLEMDGEGVGGEERTTLRVVFDTLYLCRIAVVVCTVSCIEQPHPFDIIVAS
jgi:hypothetical protein